MTESHLYAWATSGLATLILGWILGRKKRNADTNHVTVTTALAIEERVTTRYNAAIASLDLAQRALDEARAEIRGLEDYVDVLHDILRKHNIDIPTRPLTNTKT